MDLLAMQLDYDAWMIEQIIDSCTGLSDEQMEQEFDIGLGHLRLTVDHLIANVHFWTALMTGTSAEIDRSDCSLPALRARHERVYATFRDFALDARRNGRLEETFRDHWEVEQTIGTTILHVIFHNHLHCGEALHMLQRLGVAGLPDGDIQQWEHRSGRRGPALAAAGA